MKQVGCRVASFRFMGFHLFQQKLRQHLGRAYRGQGNPSERASSTETSNGSFHPFFPGILLSRKPPETLGKQLVFEKNDG